MADLSEDLRLLVAMSEAFEQPSGHTGSREPLMFLRFAGGQSIQHHAFSGEDWQNVDEEMLEHLHTQGMIRLDYREHNTNIYVTQ